MARRASMLLVALGLAPLPLLLARAEGLKPPKAPAATSEKPSSAPSTAPSSSTAASAEAPAAGDKPPAVQLGQVFYPLTFRAHIALDPGGTIGRFGLEVARFSGHGFGLGLGLAGGRAQLATPEGAPAGQPANSGFWVEPVLRPGWVFSIAGDPPFVGWAGVAITPTFDFLTFGNRFSLVAEPGFQLGVGRFWFGLSMRIGGLVTSSVPAETGGFSIGLAVALGLVF